MSKKRWILIILAILIWAAAACFLLPWKIWSDCQDKIDACVEAQKEWVNQICPIDCKHYEENFVVGVNSQDEFIQETKEDKPEEKKSEENEQEEPKTTGTIEVSKPSIIEVEKQEDCPEWKVLRCPMWLCLNDETGEQYPCQSNCFCVSPDMYF